MKIRRAKIEDLHSVYEITRLCTAHLLKDRIFQWNEHYPTIEILNSDIQRKELWVLERAAKIVGMIVLSDIMDEEYKSVRWSTETLKNLYIHRLAISPEYQGKGYAQQLMGFAESYAREHQYTSIRLDTFSGNKRNQKFYELRDYQRIEAIYLPNQSSSPFYCYEKALNE